MKRKIVSYRGSFPVELRRNDDEVSSPDAIHFSSGIKRIGTPCVDLSIPHFFGVCSVITTKGSKVPNGDMLLVCKETEDTGSAWTILGVIKTASNMQGDAQEEPVIDFTEECVEDCRSDMKQDLLINLVNNMMKEFRGEMNAQDPSVQRLLSSLNPTKGKSILALFIEAFEGFFVKIPSCCVGDKWKKMNKDLLIFLGKVVSNLLSTIPEDMFNAGKPEIPAAAVADAEQQSLDAQINTLADHLRVSSMVSVNLAIVDAAITISEATRLLVYAAAAAISAQKKRAETTAVTSGWDEGLVSASRDAAKAFRNLADVAKNVFQHAHCLDDEPKEAGAQCLGDEIVEEELEIIATAEPVPPTYGASRSPPRCNQVPEAPYTMLLSWRNEPSTRGLELPSPSAYPSMATPTSAQHQDVTFRALNPSPLPYSI